VPQSLGSAKVQQDREEEAGLLAAAHSTRFVFDPDAALGRHSQCIGHDRRAFERCHNEGRTVDRFDDCVQLANEASSVVGRHAVSLGIRRPSQMQVSCNER
jgi:hypothetical protein